MTRFAVAVPARDEETLLPRCLASLDAAAVHLRRTVPGAVVVAVVALDSCRDGSAEAVAAAAASSSVEIVAVSAELGSASRARQLACCAALGLAVAPGGHGPDWLATTDADTVVPENWLLAQHDAMRLGYDLFVGTAEPDPADVGPELLELFRAQHDHRLGHHHVHGASLGLSARAFALTGGFAPIDPGEDQDLVDRARALGLTVLASDGARVTTSGRLVSRVRGGFADYLAALSR